ncbi:MAG: GNAT family N-acetyltransferase [Myxococcales bacterium]|nr:GNAT family N-acetyltransferase [Myxococcales bacterium]
MTPRATPTLTRFQVRLLRPAESRDFERINRLWLAQHFAGSELGDDEVALLRDPWQHVGEGGRVFAAVEIGGKTATTAHAERVIGVCAMIVRDSAALADSVELAKLGVEPAARGRGVGRALVGAVIAAARVMGKRRVRLNSDSRLDAAMRLYTKLGFQRVEEAPLLGRRGDVEMTLTLDTPRQHERHIETEALLADGARYASEYACTLDQRAVFPGDADVAALAGFDEALPEGPCDARSALAALHHVAAPATVASTGGRYFGFVIGGAMPATIAASWMATAWDQNAGLEVCSPAAAHLEEVVERWLLEILGLPARSAVGLVSGATSATFCALAAARHQLLARKGWDVEADGLYGAPPLRVVLGEQAHTTVFKALALLGLGRARVERVAVDEQGRMRAGALPRLDGSTIVVAQAGNVDSGSFDPIDEIAARTTDSGAWLHVDGAFGLWAAAAPATRHLVRGLERCDSWAVDAHKYLNVPYDSGIVICRHPQQLAAALSLGAAYLQPSVSGRDSYRYTPALSRRARAVEIWTALKTLGRSGVAELIERTCRLAQRLAELLAARGYRVLNDVVLNQVLVACDSDAETLAVLREVQRSGECWCGGTRWRGEAAIRLSVSSWATTEDDIERSVAAFERARGRLAAAGFSAPASDSARASAWR